MTQYKSIPSANLWEDDTVYTADGDFDRDLCDTIPVLSNLLREGTDPVTEEKSIPTAFLIEGKRNVTLECLLSI